MRRFALGAAAALMALAALLIYPGAAVEGARRGLGVCAEVIIPSLFPFFVLSSAIMELGVPARLARALSPLTRRLFGVSGAGAAAFFMGVLGGYPLGAATAAGLAGRGDVSRREATRLLGFCNNSGPAFLIGAAGVGVFGSARAGMALYASHVIAAVVSGVLMRGKNESIMSTSPALSEPQPGALTRAVTASVRNILNVCGFVVTFACVVDVLDAAGVFARLAGELAYRTALDAGAARALLSGFFEIGGGISALRGCEPTRLNFALVAFIIGWGGLSVHFQTASAVSAAGLGTRRHTAARILSAVLGAAMAAALYPLTGLGL